MHVCLGSLHFLFWVNIAGRESRKTFDDVHEILVSAKENCTGRFAMNVNNKHQFKHHQLYACSSCFGETSIIPIYVSDILFTIYTSSPFYRFIWCLLTHHLFYLFSTISRNHNFKIYYLQNPVRPEWVMTLSITTHLQFFYMFYFYIILGYCIVIVRYDVPYICMCKTHFHLKTKLLHYGPVISTKILRM